ncbi:hypothetical protein [Methylobacterium brachythecii]|uniref:Uncharacterized protein n=1 Tax=Methylobacterium brachythecii TaxID=1176177 RepID=A0A7W6AHB1_9HYPH|nr:hypothetical protein [Methylobacterium brachythecii]MBB3902321.1 hypothetical protein [Methylobacterium brachythecii]GLS42170.1 hypothetical protein GCM10007884_01550 [Methylobacterium brachythecii]
MPAIQSAVPPTGRDAPPLPPAEGATAFRASVARTTPPKDEYKKAGPDTQAPEGFKIVGPEGEVAPGTIRYEAQDGAKVVVAREDNPDLYDKAVAARGYIQGVNESLDVGYRLAGATERPQDSDIAIVGSPTELAPGLIRYQTPEGEKILVERTGNEALYNQVSDRYDTLTEPNLEKRRKDAGLPSLGETDTSSAETSVQRKEDDPAAGKFTVSELAVKTLYDDYSKGVDDGSIPKDDPRAKLVRALEAKTAYEDGRQITPYIEDTGGIETLFGGTYRRASEKPETLTGADMRDVINGHALDTATNDLFANEQIGADYSAHLKDAVGQVPDHDKLVDRARDLVTSPEYACYIEGLKSDGLTREAQTDVTRTLASLSSVDPEAADKAAQELQVNSLTLEYNRLMADPSQISDAAKTQATTDVMELVKKSVQAGVNIPRRTIDTIDKYYKSIKDEPGKIKQLQATLESLNGENVEGRQFTQDQLDRAMRNAHVPVAEQGGLTGFLGEMNKAGVLGSTAATVQMVSGVYHLTKTGLDGSWEQNLAIAKDFVGGFLGGGKNFIKLGGAIADVMGKPGTIDALGLDKSLPEIWSKGGTVGRELPGGANRPAAGPPVLPETAQVADAFSREMGQIINGVPATNLPEGTRGVADAVTGNLDEAARGAGIASDAATPSGISKGARIAGSAVKVLGNLADGFGGIADLVLGGVSLDKAIKAGDGDGKVAPSLQIVSGGLTALAAGAEGIALAGGSAAISAGVGAAFGAIAAPLFLGAAVIGGIGLIVGEVLAHKKVQKATDEEGQWFKDLAYDGLMQGDWGDKLEYARYSFYKNEGRDAPQDQTFFQFQAKEWEHFRTTPQEDGSSLNRLDGALHIDSDPAHW